MYVEAKARPSTYIPIVGAFIGGADSSSNLVTLNFDAQGKLVNHSTTLEAAEEKYAGGQWVEARFGDSFFTEYRIMKTLIQSTIAIALAGAVSLASAQERPGVAAGTPIDPASRDHFCSEIGRVAGTAMKARQDGAPIGEVLESFQKSVEGNAVLVGLVRNIVMDAYGRSSYTTDTVKKRAITEFSNQWQLACLKDGA